MEKDKDLNEALDLVKTTVEEEKTKDTQKKGVKESKKSTSTKTKAKPKSKEALPEEEVEIKAESEVKTKTKDKLEDKPEEKAEDTAKKKAMSKAKSEEKTFLEGEKGLDDSETVKGSFLSPEVIAEAKRSKEIFLSLPSSRQRQKRERLAPRELSLEERELMMSLRSEEVLTGVLGLRYLEDRGKSFPVFKIIYGDALVYIPQKEFLLSNRKIIVSAMHGAVGSIVPFQVIQKLDDDEGQSIYIASRKRALEKKFLEEATMAEEGKLYTGTIISVNKNYLWVECLGLDFMISRLDLHVQKDPDLRNVYKNNDEIRLRLVEYSLEDAKFKVTAKSSEEDPKEVFTRYYKSGDVTTGRILLDPEAGYLVRIQLGNYHTQLVYCPNEPWLEGRAGIGDLVNVKIKSFYTAKDNKTGEEKFYVRGYIVSLQEKQIPGVY